MRDLRPQGRGRTGRVEWDRVEWDRVEWGEGVGASPWRWGWRKKVWDREQLGRPGGI